MTDEEIRTLWEQLMAPFKALAWSMHQVTADAMTKLKEDAAALGLIIEGKELKNG